jgi:BNR/Asp-box repeat
LVFGLLANVDLAAQVWTSIGPAPIAGANGPTGRITSLAVDPTDANHWMLGSAGGGVWDSRDAGASWTPLTDAQPTLIIGSVAFAPSNPQVIYAGTGEATYVNDALAGQGILKSTDGGTSWTLTGSPTFARTSIGAIRVHPSNANIALAIMSRSAFGRNYDSFFVPSIGPPPFGVQRTTDGGLTWTRTLSGESMTLEIDPTDFANQYTVISLPAGYGAYTPGPRGVHRSRDGGQTWSAIAGPWSAINGRILLAMAPSNRNTLYASLEGADRRLFGLFRTDNAWAESPDWIRVSTAGNWASGGVNYPDYCGDSCTPMHLIAVDAVDPNILYAGGTTLWRCDNCGATPTWKDIGAGSHTGKRCIAWSGNRLHGRRSIQYNHKR